eukprot:GDKJ01018666.1.p1 GENE.GDKJ01018666.1~~GDKJ01018666.1.p1  ORF type:complete len:1391 (-),score=308.82 GDKJ01018666.1:111-4283(-)
MSFVLVTSTGYCSLFLEPCLLQTRSLYDENNGWIRLQAQLEARQLKSAFPLIVDDLRKTHNAESSVLLSSCKDFSEGLDTETGVAPRIDWQAFKNLGNEWRMLPLAITFEKFTEFVLDQTQRDSVFTLNADLLLSTVEKNEIKVEKRRVKKSFHEVLDRALWLMWIPFHLQYPFLSIAALPLSSRERSKDVLLLSTHMHSTLTNMMAFLNMEKLDESSTAFRNALKPIFDLLPPLELVNIPESELQKWKCTDFLYHSIVGISTTYHDVAIKVIHRLFPLRNHKNWHLSIQDEPYHLFDQNMDESYLTEAQKLLPSLPEVENDYIDKKTSPRLFAAYYSKSKLDFTVARQCFDSSFQTISQPGSSASSSSLSPISSSLSRSIDSWCSMKRIFAVSQFIVDHKWLKNVFFTSQKVELERDWMIFVEGLKLFISDLDISIINRQFYRSFFEKNIMSNRIPEDFVRTFLHSSDFNDIANALSDRVDLFCDKNKFANVDCHLNWLSDFYEVVSLMIDPKRDSEAETVIGSDTLLTSFQIDSLFNAISSSLSFLKPKTTDFTRVAMLTQADIIRERKDDKQVLQTTMSSFKTCLRKGIDIISEMIDLEKPQIFPLESLSEAVETYPYIRLANSECKLVAAPIIHLWQSVMIRIFKSLYHVKHFPFNQPLNDDLSCFDFNVIPKKKPEEPKPNCPSVQTDYESFIAHLPICAQGAVLSNIIPFLMSQMNIFMKLGMSKQSGDEFDPKNPFEIQTVTEKFILSDTADRDSHLLFQIFEIFKSIQLMTPVSQKNFDLFVEHCALWPRWASINHHILNWKNSKDESVIFRGSKVFNGSELKRMEILERSAFCDSSDSFMITTLNEMKTMKKESFMVDYVFKENSSFNKASRCAFYSMFEVGRHFLRFLRDHLVCPAHLIGFQLGCENCGSQYRKLAEKTQKITQSIEVKFIINQSSSVSKEIDLSSALSDLYKLIEDEFPGLTLTAFFKDPLNENETQLALLKRISATENMMTSFKKIYSKLKKFSEKILSESLSDQNFIKIFEKMHSFLTTQREEKHFEFFFKQKKGDSFLIRDPFLSCDHFTDEEENEYHEFDLEDKAHFSRHLKVFTAIGSGVYVYRIVQNAEEEEEDNWPNHVEKKLESLDRAVELLFEDWEKLIHFLTNKILKMVEQFDSLKVYVYAIEDLANDELERMYRLTELMSRKSFELHNLITSLKSFNSKKPSILQSVDEASVQSGVIESIKYTTEFEDRSLKAARQSFVELYDKNKPLISASEHLLSRIIETRSEFEEWLKFAEEDIKITRQKLEEAKEALDEYKKNKNNRENQSDTKPWFITVIVLSSTIPILAISGWFGWRKYKKLKNEKLKELINEELNRHMTDFSNENDDDYDAFNLDDILGGR